MPKMSARFAPTRSCITALCFRSTQVMMGRNAAMITRMMKSSLMMTISIAQLSAWSEEPARTAPSSPRESRSMPAKAGTELASSRETARGS